MKGQSMIEFMALISMSALVLAGLQTIMVSKQSETYKYQNQRKAEKIAEYVSFQVEMALVQGDGYSRVFSIPENVGGRPYNVTVVNGSSYLRWGKSSVLQPSRYRSEAIEVSTFDSNTFRIVNRGREVDIVEQ